MRRAAWLGVVLMLSGLSGCLTDGDRPYLRLEVVPAEVPANGMVTLNVEFVNTDSETFEIRGAQGCVPLEAWTTAGANVVSFEPPQRNTPEDCEAWDRDLRVEPGNALDWTLQLDLGAYTLNDGPLFKAGQSYDVHVDIDARSTSWDVSNVTSFRVVAATDLPRIEVSPEQDQWRAGQTTEITVSFTNTADTSFTYTSSDTCNDIRVHVLDTKGEGTRTQLYPQEGGYACGQALTEFTIRPGEKVEATVVWDGSRDGEGGEPYVSPGAYTIVADFDGSRHAWETEGMAAVSILASS